MVLPRDVILTSEWRRGLQAGEEGGNAAHATGSALFFPPVAIPWHPPSHQENEAEKRFNYVYDAPLAHAVLTLWIHLVGGE
jgi:hypothetical protein